MALRQHIAYREADGGGDTLLILTKAVTDSDLIPATRSDAKPVTLGAKRRWCSYGA
ncbi:MAG TPA: hypothetical protein VMT20_19605 [Terriglobia bacterium]|nr:hypothetical protein [Terriglobia bacterium]